MTTESFDLAKGNKIMHFLQTGINFSQHPPISEEVILENPSLCHLRLKRALR